MLWNDSLQLYGTRVLYMNSEHCITHFSPLEKSMEIYFLFFVVVVVEIVAVNIISYDVIFVYQIKSKKCISTVVAHIKSNIDWKGGVNHNYTSSNYMYEIFIYIKMYNVHMNYKCACFQPPYEYRLLLVKLLSILFVSEFLMHVQFHIAVYIYVPRLYFLLWCTFIYNHHK